MAFQPSIIMKHNLLFTAFLCFTSCLSAQITSLVLDSMDHQPVPYINIWVVQEGLGTSSDENGRFSLPAFGPKHALVFNALGYKPKTLLFSEFRDTIYLVPQSIELAEVIIAPRKRTTIRSTGSYKKAGINYYLGAGNRKPCIFARYFPYEPLYMETPFLQTVKVLTNSDIRRAVFNIRLYSVAPDGTPQDYLYDKNILGVARKGKTFTEIDLSKLNICIPKQGLVVAVEWLLIESNKYEYRYTEKGSKKKKTGFTYCPSLGTIPNETNENSWFYAGGKWNRVLKNSGPVEKYWGKYNLLAMELVLSD